METMCLAVNLTEAPLPPRLAGPESHSSRSADGMSINFYPDPKPRKCIPRSRTAARSKHKEAMGFGLMMTRSSLSLNSKWAPGGTAILLP